MPGTILSTPLKTDELPTVGNILQKTAGGHHVDLGQHFPGFNLLNQAGTTQLKEPAHRGRPLKISEPGTHQRSQLQQDETQEKKAPAQRGRPRKISSQNVTGSLSVDESASLV